MATWIVNTLINPFISSLASVINVILSVFPSSPFSADSASITSISDWLQYINWFLPMGLILDTISATLVAVGIYYAWSIVGRWVKVIE